MSDVPRLSRRAGDYIGDVLKWTSQMTLSVGAISPLIIERNAEIWVLGTLLAAISFILAGVVVIYLSEEGERDG